MTAISALPLLLSRTEAAQALRCTPETVDRLVGAGRLRPVRLFPEVDEELRFRPEDLLALIDQAVALYPLEKPRSAT